MMMMMDITVDELLTRNKSVQNHESRSDLKTVPSTEERSSGLSCDAKVGEKRQRNEEDGEVCNIENRSVLNHYGRGSNNVGVAERRQLNWSESVGAKFNNFNHLREEAKFGVGQTWALYDTADGMPRLYAQIRKVSLSPCFGLRITYLEPDPDDEKELQWFEQDLPVSVGNFRLGKNQNTKDRSRFSHVIHCNEGRNKTTRMSHFAISPRKGETWALLKDWDINWSLEPNSHRKYEYEFVEILSDYTDEAGVYLAYLHKAKGFASVFFRMDAHIFRILKLYNDFRDSSTKWTYLWFSSHLTIFFMLYMGPWLCCARSGYAKTIF